MSDSTSSTTIQVPGIEGDVTVYVGTSRHRHRSYRVSTGNPPRELSGGRIHESGRLVIDRGGVEASIRDHLLARAAELNGGGQ